MAPKKRKAPAAPRSVAPVRKKQKASSSLRADIETAPSSSDSPPPVPRTGVICGAGPSSHIDVTPARKKQKTSSLRTGVETAPSSSDSPPPVPRTGVICGAGPSSHIIESEWISVASGEESIYWPESSHSLFFCSSRTPWLRESGHNWNATQKLIVNTPYILALR